MNINDYKSKDGDVTGAGYEFVGNKRQSAGDMKSYIKKRHMREKKYLDFVLNPDTEEPMRMPSDFTYPTNIVSVKENGQLLIGSTGAFTGWFAPQNQLLCDSTSSNYIPYDGTDATEAAGCAIYAPWGFYSYTAGDFLTNTKLGQQFGTSGGSASATHAIFTTPTNFQRKWQGPNKFPYSSQFDTARCIGAVCEISYIGALENTSGVINIAADIEPANTKGAGNINIPTVSELYNLLMYKKYRASETTRSLWFPVDPSAQNFQNANPLNNPGSSQQAQFSQLLFYFIGYGLPIGSTLDITIQMYYEVVPNLQFSNLFVGSQAVSKEDPKSAWDEILQFGKDNLGQILITGSKIAADFLPGGKAISAGIDYVGKLFGYN